jgi:hypothetical protein
MATNFYFQSGVPGGRSSEQLLVEDIIIECLKIYGFDVYYMPRQTVYQDNILNEDVLNKFDYAYPLEMYMSSNMGFEGEGDLLTKFGVEVRDTATFIVSRRRWDEVVARTGTAQLTTRPAEGDVLYFPLTKAFFEIMRVDSTDPFFQVGKLYVYKLECELLRFSSERFNTGVEEIDEIVDDKSMDVNDYNILLEDGTRIKYEYFTNSFMINEIYELENIIPNVSNETFRDEIDILDFTEKNPFGEVL